MTYDRLTNIIEYLKTKINSENAMHAELINSSIDTLLAYRIIIKKTKTKKTSRQQLNYQYPKTNW